MYPQNLLFSTISRSSSKVTAFSFGVSTCGAEHFLSTLEAFDGEEWRRFLGHAAHSPWPELLTRCLRALPSFIFRLLGDRRSPRPASGSGWRKSDDHDFSMHAHPRPRALRDDHAAVAHRLTRTAPRHRRIIEINLAQPRELGHRPRQRASSTSTSFASSAQPWHPMIAWACF